MMSFSCSAIAVLVFSLLILSLHNCSLTSRMKNLSLQSYLNDWRFLFNFHPVIHDNYIFWNIN